MGVLGVFGFFFLRSVFCVLIVANVSGLSISFLIVSSVSSNVYIRSVVHDFFLCKTASIIQSRCILLLNDGVFSTT